MPQFRSFTKRETLGKVGDRISADFLVEVGIVRGEHALKGFRTEIRTLARCTQHYQPVCFALHDRVKMVQTVTKRHGAR